LVLQVLNLEALIRDRQ
jgi:hypothetical protein